jgi:hypothetical protein
MVKVQLLDGPDPDRRIGWYDYSESHYYKKGFCFNNLVIVSVDFQNVGYPLI